MWTTSLAKAAIVAAALLPVLTAAQTDPGKARLRAAIAQELTALMGDGSRALVEKLKGVKADGDIADNFNLQRIVPPLFGRNAPRSAADCQVTQTPMREAATGPCVMEFGERDSPTGAYTQFSYSRNIGIGDIEFVRRAAFSPGGSTSLPAVQLSDEKAYEQALRFLELVGVPMSEVPKLPSGAKLPVRTLAVGSVDERGTSTKTGIQKVVSIPRAFRVPGGLLTGPNKELLEHVLAPGGAVVAMDDKGWTYAAVDGWSSAQFADVDPKLSKTTAQLADEITDDLWAEGMHGAIGSLSILVVLRKGYPNPEDPDPPKCPVCGLLLPAVQVSISERGRERFDSSEKNFAPPGLVREYDLVAGGRLR